MDTDSIEEVESILFSKECIFKLQVFYLNGRMKELMPELLPMVGCEQSAKYHSEGDVWMHTKLVVYNSLPISVVKWAAFLHDSGKPHTKEIKVKDGINRITNYGHEKVSVKITKEVLNRLGMDDEKIEKVCWCIRNHMRMHQWGKMRQFKKDALLEHENFEYLLDLHKADCLSSIRSDDTGDTMGPDLETYKLIREDYSKVKQKRILEEE